MDLLTGLSAASGLLNGAANLVQSFKQPRVTDQAFSELFKAQFDVESSAESQQARALEMSRNFIALRDTNGDAMLRMDESGLTRAQFEALDRDKDGQLSSSELQAGIIGRGTA
jgi:hypothetical protein